MADGPRRAPRALRHVTFMIGLAITLALLVTAAVSSVYTPRDPLEMSIAVRLQGPTAAHPLCTDGATRRGRPRANGPAVPAQPAASADRAGRNRHSGGDPGRGPAHVSQARVPAAPPIVGTNDQGAPGIPRNPPVVCHLPGWGA